MESRLVIECNFLARLDIAKGDKENMAIKDFHVAVWFAGVVYVVRAVAALAAVEAPAIINGANTESASSGTAISFRIGYSLTGVLRYLSPLAEVCL